MPPSAAALRYQSAIPYTLRHAPSAPANETSLARSSAELVSAMRKSSSGHVIGVPVTSKAYGIEEVSSRDPSFRKGDAAGDHLAVSLTHPSPYASFGYKHSKS